MIHVKWIEKRRIKARNKMKYKSIQRNLVHWAYLVNHLKFPHNISTKSKYYCKSEDDWISSNFIAIYICKSCGCDQGTLNMKTWRGHKKNSFRYHQRECPLLNVIR